MRPASKEQRAAALAGRLLQRLMDRGDPRDAQLIADARAELGDLTVAPAIAKKKKPAQPTREQRRHLALLTALRSSMTSLELDMTLSEDEEQRLVEAMATRLEAGGGTQKEGSSGSSDEDDLSTAEEYSRNFLVFVDSAVAKPYQLGVPALRADRQELREMSHRFWSKFLDLFDVDAEEETATLDKMLKRLRQRFNDDVGLPDYLARTRLAEMPNFDKASAQKSVDVDFRAWLNEYYIAHGGRQPRRGDAPRAEWNAVMWGDAEGDAETPSKKTRIQATLDSCASCGTPSPAVQCGAGCGSAAYCDQQCADMHWHDHACTMSK